MKSLLAARAAATRATEAPQETEGWVLLSQDLNPNVEAYGLRVKPGYRLLLFCAGEMGDCFSQLYAVPQRGPLVALDSREGPRPAQALEHFMQAIEGPDEEASYLAAALLARDGEEWGARWHGCNWAAHEVLLESPFFGEQRLQELALELEAFRQTTPVDSMDLYAAVHPQGPSLQQEYHRKRRQGKQPRLVGEDLRQQIVWTHQNLTQATSWLGSIYYNDSRYSQYRESHPALPDSLRPLLRRISARERWTWHEPLPEIWWKVEMGEEQVVVTFHTYSGHRGERLERHLSFFARGHFCPRRESQLIGEGPGGYLM